jgi:hypothetical protein
VHWCRHAKPPFGQAAWQAFRLAEHGNWQVPMAAAQSRTHARLACDGVTIVADAATSTMANSSLFILPPDRR